MGDRLHELGGDRFQDVRRVGAGNNAIVYRAWDRDLERRVALKVSLADTLLDIFGGERMAELGIADGLQRLVDEVTTATRSRYTLLREARLLARVHHPNVVAALDVGVLDGSLTLVMPYLAGGQLGYDRIEGPWERALEQALAIGEGLAAIHDAGVLHRDIKPNNVLFDLECRPYIIDFGLACLMEDTEALAEWPGTSAYMAPETLARRHRDHRDDLYAFCIVAFQMLYGHMPFASDAARREGTVSQLEHRRGPSAAIRQVLARGLHPDMDERWPNMGMLVDALREASPPPRRWPGVAGTAAAMMSAGLAVALLTPSSRVQASSCEEVASELETVWNRDIALEVRGAISRVSSDSLDDWARRWLEMRARECERDLPRASACADRMRSQFETTVAVLRHPHEREGLDYSAVIDELPPPERCLDAAEPPKDVVVGLQALRERDTEVAVWIASGELERAREKLEEYAALALTYGSKFDLARAALRRGQIDRRAALPMFPGAQAHRDAAKQLELAYAQASEIGAALLGGEAALELMAVDGTRGDREALRAHALVARPVFERLDPDRVAEVHVLEGLGLLEGSQAEREHAVELLREAVGMREQQLQRYGGSREQLASAMEALAQGLLSVGQLHEAYLMAERSFELHAATHGRGSAPALRSKRVMFAARVRLGHDRRYDPVSDLENLQDEILADKDLMALAKEYQWIASVYADAGADERAHEYREIAKNFSASAVCGGPNGVHKPQ